MLLLLLFTAFDSLPLRITSLLLRFIHGTKWITERIGHASVGKQGKGKSTRLFMYESGDSRVSEF
jgi:hypothetical protein